MPTTTFPFTFTTSGPAGPSAAPAGVSLLAGTTANPNCVIVGQFRAGTLVTITEGAVPGTGVLSITSNPTGNLTASSLSAGTATVNMGAGETVVTYTDQYVNPGTLKLCTYPGTPPPVTGTTGFTYTITSNAAATTTVTVPLQTAGACVIVGTYPFNSTETIVQAASTGNAVQTIAVNPASQIVGTANISTGTVSLTMLANDIVEADYTNTDPPAVSTGGGNTGSTGSTGGIGASSSSSTGSTGSSTGSSVRSTGSSTGSTGSGTGSTGSTGSSTSVVGSGTGLVISTGVTASDSSSLKLSSDKTELAALKATLAKLETAHAKAAKANKTLAREIAVAKTSLSTLERKFAEATGSLKTTLAKEITAAKVSLSKLETTYTKDVYNTTAKENATTNTTITQLAAAIALLEK